MVAYSFGYQRVSSDERFKKDPVIYRGADAVDKFMECMRKEEKEIKEILTRNEPMVVNEFVKMEYYHSTACYACKNLFTKKNDKVIDHDHLSGEVRGTACNKCNLRMKVPKFISVIFHNLKGFDGYLIMQGIGKYKESDIKFIPNNQEKYLSFSLGSLRFMDSLQFLNESLATLTKNLAQEGNHHFKYLRKSFPNPENFSLLTRKGVFPYDYVDRQRTETRGDTLTVQRGVLQSPRRFRDLCIQEYELDSCHYFTSPGFSWSAMLKKKPASFSVLSRTLTCYSIVMQRLTIHT